MSKKKHILFLLIFFSLIKISIAQKANFDKVEIFAIPFYTDFSVDNIDGDYVRSHPVYTFSSTDTSYINKLHDKIFSNKSESTNVAEPKGEVRVVIDFKSRNQISSYVLINLGFEYYCAQLSHNSINFQKIGIEECFITECIPFAKNIEYGLGKCK